ncbi:MAG: type VI secretion system baseplate subunit TssF [Paracoccaceae bacterium]|nr:type VI secretion system baseplate subunit TssF [Paracoccaceae bacterium]
MDRLFLEYYNDDLTYLRHLAADFADMNGQIARHLSLKETPCPDPYVERLLEGVAFLAARTRLKIDTEQARLSRDILEMLYPDLAAPTPSVGRIVMEPGDQVMGMFDGYHVSRGTRLITDPQDDIQTRATYTTAQDVHLWPIQVRATDYLANRSTLEAAGLTDAEIGTAEAALRIEIAPAGADPLAALSLDALTFTFEGAPMAGALFDAVHGHGSGALARPRNGPITRLDKAGMQGIDDCDSLFPRTRAGFEGYRLLREYFVLPERFHNMTLDGLGPAIRGATAEGQTLEIFIPLARPVPQIAAVKPRNMLLFSTPIVNLFERECSTVDVDTRGNGKVVFADKARPRDYEIYALVSVKDLERDDGDETHISNAASVGALAADGPVYAIERQPRRPGPGEKAQGKYRSTYNGDEVRISLSQRRMGEARRRVRRLDIRALCSNRDLPILEPRPNLTSQSGLPVGKIRLLSALKRPIPALKSGLLRNAASETVLEDISWRLVAHLSLNFLSLAEEGEGSVPLRGLLQIYADRGDSTLRDHARALIAVQSAETPERLPLDGPICFGTVTDVTCDFDDQVFVGQSRFLLGALLGQVFSRYAGLNAFVRCTTTLARSGESVAWPMRPGVRRTI